LRGFLKARLPDYMVPAELAVLPSLPLLPSGKVDRRALAELAPAPAADEPALEAAPRTPIEELLAGIFAEVLSREWVGREDSFFDVGGHSLTAAQVVARTRAVLGVELPLRAIFETPTVAALAERLERAMRSGDAALQAPPERVARDRPLPLSFGQQ